MIQGISRYDTDLFITEYSWFSTRWVNSLAPGKFEWNFRHVIFKEILVIDGWGISCETALIWMSLDFTDDGALRQQAITWANVDPDLCPHLASLGHNNLIEHTNHVGMVHHI